MTISIKEINGEVRASIEGRMDSLASEKAAGDFQLLNEQADRHIEIDCSKLEYISSSGLRLFFVLQKQVKEKGGTLVIRNVNNNIREVFTITGFYRIFDIR